MDASLVLRAGKRCESLQLSFQFSSQPQQAIYHPKSDKKGSSAYFHAIAVLTLFWTYMLISFMQVSLCGVSAF